MAVFKFLLLGVLLCIASTGLLILSMATDQWFIFDASEYRRRCPEEDIFGPLASEYGSAICSVNKISPIPTTYSSYTVVPQESKHDIQRYKQVARFNGATQNWPGIPLLSRIKDKGRYDGAKPIPLLAANFSRGPIRAKDDVTVENKNNITQVNPFRTETRLALWTRLKHDLEINLRHFGGRDVAFNRVQQPSGSRSNDCAKTSTESIKKDRQILTRCKSNRTLNAVRVAECKKRQFSTYGGLWRTCYLFENASILDRMAQCGNFRACALVPYNDIKTTSFPAALQDDEINDVYLEEWRTLHLRRIMTSFLCMAVPVQIFGLILILIGWRRRSGFIIYTGGLMLIMSGIFQLLAVGTSILLFDAELSRSPPDVYKFPAGVRERFGRSAYTAWVATGCIFIAGVVCSLAPTISYRPRTTSSISQVNGTIDEQQYSVIRDQERSVSLLRRGVTIDVIPEVPVERSQLKRKRDRLNKASVSLDMGSYRRIDRPKESDPIGGSEKWHVKKKTKSVPNLQSASRKTNASQTRRSRSSTRRNSRHRPNRTLSPVATVRTPRAAIKALEEEQLLRREDTTDFSTGIEYRDFKSHPWQKPEDRATSSCYLMRRNTTQVPYSHSVYVGRPMYHTRSLKQPTDAMITHRPEAYSNRNSYPLEVPSNPKYVVNDAQNDNQNICENLIPIPTERRTRSLPRSTMKHTPLSELATIGGIDVLKDHCELFLQRQIRRGNVIPSEIIPQSQKRPRPSPLTEVGRQYSDDPRIYSRRAMNPIVHRWTCERIRWAKSLDEGGYSRADDTHDYCRQLECRVADETTHEISA